MLLWGLVFYLGGLAAHPALAGAAGAAHAARATHGAGQKGELQLRAGSALVLDQSAGQAIYAKNPDAVRPIASITKLMTALVTLKAGLPLDEVITIDPGDVDTLKHTHSRLQEGCMLSRHDLMRLALMSSENRAAAALGRSFPGGVSAFVQRMNETAAALGMTSSHFADPTGLSSENVSTAWDLSRLVQAGCQQDLIREFTTTARWLVDISNGKGRQREFHNTNPLVSDSNWEINLSKTGFIGEAGPCLVMDTKIADRPYVIVILDAQGKLSRVADARRIRRWLETGGNVRVHNAG